MENMKVYDDNVGTVQGMVDALADAAKKGAKWPVVGSVSFLDFEGEGWTDWYPVKSGKKTPNGIQLKGPSRREGYMRDWIKKEAVTVERLLKELQAVEDKSQPMLVKNISHKKYEPAESVYAEEDGPFGPWFCINGGSFHQARS